MIQNRLRDDRLEKNVGIGRVRLRARRLNEDLIEKLLFQFAIASYRHVGFARRRGRDAGDLLHVLSEQMRNTGEHVRKVLLLLLIDRQ